MLSAHSGALESKLPHYQWACMQGNNCTIKVWKTVNQSNLSAEISPVAHLYDVLEFNPLLPVSKSSLTCNLIWIQHTHIQTNNWPVAIPCSSWKLVSATPVPWLHLGLCRSKELRPSAQTSAAASSSWCSSVFSASLTSEPSPGPGGSRAWIAETALPAPCSWSVLQEHTQKWRGWAFPAKRGTVAGNVKFDAIYRKRYWLLFCTNKTNSILRRQNQRRLWFVFHTSKIYDYLWEQKKGD